MNKREKWLAAGVAALALFVVGRAALDFYLDLFSSRQQQVTSLEADVQKKRLAVARGNTAQLRLAAYERRSLPADLQLARASYNNWLLSLVQEAKLTGTDVSAQTGMVRKENFNRLTYTINGRGNLEQVVRLLYNFYSADHLHKLKRLDVEPVDSGNSLDISMTIEALSMPSAKQQVELSTQPGDRLAEKEWEPYRKSIVGRNLFAAYVPPKAPVEREREPEPPPKPNFDVAKYAFVTAIIAVDGRPQVWLLVRTTGKTLKLFEGDHFEVGNVGADVVAIGKRSVEIAVDGKRLLASLGESLRDAATLEPK